MEVLRTVLPVLLMIGIGMLCRRTKLISREGVNALNSSDLSMLKALVLLGAILFIVINLITDVAYAWVDPRVRVDRD